MSANNDASSDDARRTTRDTLWLCLDTGLHLLHPFMPFILEELWQCLPQRAGDKMRKESIMIADYPAVVEV